MSTARETGAPRATLGRPRDAERQESVLAATRASLREAGYSRLTIDGVAERAGVSRALIYRWWPTKAELVQEALFPFLAGRPTPDTGTFAGDLRVLVEYKVASFSRPEMVRGLPGLYADLVAAPELLSRTARAFADPSFERWRLVFGRAAARGEVDPSLDARLAFQACTGMVMRLAQERVLRGAALIDYVTGLMLGGVASRPVVRPKVRLAAAGGGARRPPRARRRQAAV